MSDSFSTLLMVSHEAKPGLNVKIPFIDKVAGRVNLRVQQLNVKIGTRTEDNVFVQMIVAVQYFVLPDKVYDADYTLANQCTGAGQL